MEHIETGVGLVPDIETVYIGSANSLPIVPAEIRGWRSDVLHRETRSSYARLLKTDNLKEVTEGIQSLYDLYTEESADALVAAYDGDPYTFTNFLEAQEYASLDTRDPKIEEKYARYHAENLDLFAEILLGLRPLTPLPNESFQLLTRWMMFHEVNADMLLSNPDARTESKAMYTQMRNVTRALTKEAVTMLAKAETAEERVDLLTLYYRSFHGFQLISDYAEAIEKGESIPIPETDYDEKGWMEEISLTFPKASLAREIVTQEWFFRMAEKQVSEGMSVPERRVFVSNLLARFVAIGGYHEKAGAYTDMEARDVQKLYTTIVDLVDRDELPENFTMASVGCGDGLRVEAELLKKLRLLGEKYVPKHITGIDFIKQMSEIPGMSFVESDILDIPSNHPELLGQADLVIAFGSPFNNMDALPEQLRYLQIVRQLLRDERGIFIHDTGSFDPVPGQNTRVKAAREYFDKFKKVIGSVGINPAYKIDSDSIDETGAFLYLHDLYVTMSHLSGFVVLSPSDDPVTYAEQKARVQTLKDFVESTKEGRSALVDPYYCANPPEVDAENLEKLPVNGRVLIVSKAIPASEMTDLVSHLSRQANRIIV